MDSALLLAFERGYNAIPGIIAQDVKTWGEFKQVVRELKKPEVQEVYRSIVVDTLDLAADMCEKYICNREQIEKIGDIAWGGGFRMMRNEMEDAFRAISQCGYALFFISHAKDKTFKREDGTEYNQVVPSASNAANDIVRNMADIFGYAHSVRNPETGESHVLLTLRSPDESVSTGCRFKYIEPEISFTYQALTKALNDAIDKEAQATNGEFVTDEPMPQVDVEEEVAAEAQEFNDLMGQFNSLVGKIQDATGGAFGTTWAPRIAQTVEKHLGKGAKISECTPGEADSVREVLEDLTSQVEQGL